METRVLKQGSYRRSYPYAGYPGSLDCFDLWKVRERLDQGLGRYPMLETPQYSLHLADAPTSAPVQRVPVLALGGALDRDGFVGDCYLRNPVNSLSDL